ncbi:uncharacterized protein FA14DRAFT_48452 [Meira miltonrushii]|uniref:Uncharacterized protein n=1 Tax=Meira miltonrushii TaxID=1280837 RepID=A0A316VE81_9BASI|nr:uncharacterized protein FA14DRAFT_48452 [Meira miltonrushii]PWN35866.1 hypothetical protein FA14DRAFT_48452 [Meira miltonrushii]
MELVREPDFEHNSFQNGERIIDTSEGSLDNHTKQPSQILPTPPTFTLTPSQSVSANTVDSTYASLPAVPTHDPQMSHRPRRSLDLPVVPSVLATGGMNRSSSSSKAHTLASNIALKPRHHSVSSGSAHSASHPNLRNAEKDEEEYQEKCQEEEEELEELEDTDDEVEEMAEEHDHVRESEEMITLDRLETKQLVELTRNLCLSFVQSLLNVMANNATYTRLIGGSTRMEKLSKAADEACASLFNSNSRSNQEENKTQRSIERLAVLVVNAADEIEGSSNPTSASGHSNTAMDDIKLVRALSTLLASLDPDKLQGTLSQASSPSSSSHVYPASGMPAESWQRAPSHRNSISGSSSGDLRSPTSATHWPTNTNGITSNNNLTPSPSSSREELRNPFSDEEMRVPQSCGSSSSLAYSMNPTMGIDERWRDRSFILGGSNASSNGEVQRLIRLFDEIERRCHDSSTYERGIEYHDHRPQTSEAASLQAQIGAGRSLLVTRRSELLLNINPGRQRSISPSSPSPTFGRSRRNSRASSPAFNTGPPHEQIAGDPTGEAIVAGMMAGGLSASNRSKNPSNRNSIGFMPTPPQLVRRNSTKSERSFGLHSPPPRYSEDSTRNWASVTFPALTGQEAGVGNLMSQAVPTSQSEPHRRRRSASSDISTGFPTGPPAYATDSFVTAQNSEKEGSRSSSLLSPSESTLAGTISRGGIPKCYQNEKEALAAADEVSPARKSTRAEQTATETASRSMHPAQELKMLQNGIDRLMESAPQMSDQRVGPPDLQKRANQRESDLKQMVERMSKAGRLDDQRAAPPMQALGSTRRASVNDRMPKESVSGVGSSNLSGVGFSPVTSTVQSMVHTTESGHHTSTQNEKSLRSRRFPSVGSISLGSLAIRRASHLLLDNGLRSSKGKERSEQPSSPVSEKRAMDDLADFEHVSSRLATASMRGMHDQRSAPPRKHSISQRTHSRLLSKDFYEAPASSPISPNAAMERQRDSIDSDDDMRAPPRKGKSKLAAMGFDSAAMDDEDDNLFDMISSSTRRMANQDVVIGKNGATAPGSLRTSHSKLLKNFVTNETDSSDPISKTKATSPISSEFYSAKEGTVAATGLPSDHSGELKPSTFSSGNDVLNRSFRSIDERTSQQAMKSKEDEQTKAVVATKHEGNASLRYIAETQDRLGWLSVYIWSEDADARFADEIVYDVKRIAGERSTLSIQGTNECAVADFELPCRVQEGSELRGKKMKQGDFWLLRFAMEKDVDPKVAEESEIPFSAKQLASIGVTQWQCTTCSTDLMDLRDTTKFIPLPSQHWEELVDAWMCHTDQELNETLLKAQKNIEHHAGLQAGQVHVADSQLILLKTSLVKANIVDKSVSAHSPVCRIGLT